MRPTSVTFDCPSSCKPLTCCVGINADPAVVSDPDVFAQCFCDGVDEVVAVGKKPRTRRVRSTS
jgi:hypothetical protein